MSSARPRFIATALLATFIALATPQESNALLVGDSFDLSLENQNQFSNFDDLTVIDPGVEWSSNLCCSTLAPPVSVDVFGSSALFSVSSSQATTYTVSPGTKIILSDLDWVGQPGGFITAVVLGAVSTGITIVDTIISDGGHTVLIDFGNSFEFSTAGTLTAEFNFETSHGSPIPLPAALPLYGTGLAVMGFMGWRRRRKPVAAV